LVVTKLDRLARSVADTHDIAEETHFGLGTVEPGRFGAPHKPTDPAGQAAVTALAIVAGFETDPAPVAHTRRDERRQANGRLRGGV